MARRRAQQKGYVHQQGNAWYLAFREDALDADGKIVRIRRNQKIAEAKEVSKREAQRIAREILNHVDEQAQRPMSLVTVGDFIQTRFKTDVIWALKHAGQKHYKYILDKHVLPAMGDVRLRDVTTDRTIEQHGCECAGEPERSIKVQRSRRFNLRVSEGYAVEREQPAAKGD
jgi:hypothetical protein